MPIAQIAPTLGASEDNRLSWNTGSDETAEAFILGLDFFPQRFSATAQAQGAVVFAGFGIASARLDVNRVTHNGRASPIIQRLAPHQAAATAIDHRDASPIQSALVEGPLVVVAVMPEKQQLTVWLGEAELGPTAASQVSRTVPNFLTCFCIQTDYAPDISILFG